MNISPDWVKLFPDDRSREAYRRSLLAFTPLTWEIIEASQADLLRLLLGRVSADIGARVILGLALLFRNHPKAEQASQALLGTIMNEIAPMRARTLLIAIADAWSTTQRHPPHRGPDLMHAALKQAVRRLVVLDLPWSERNALRFLLDMLDDAPA